MTKKQKLNDPFSPTIRHKTPIGNAGDVFELQIKSADGTNAILNDGLFYISYLHD